MPQPASEQRQGPAGLLLSRLGTGVALICLGVGRFLNAQGGPSTVSRDATAGYLDKEMHAALEVNIPNYASAIVSADEIMDSISSLSTVTTGGPESSRGKQEIGSPTLDTH